jgi:hypothetical protein
MSRRPSDDIAKRREMARGLPTVQIARKLERGVKTHDLGISLLKPKRGSGQPDLRNDQTSNFADSV